MIGDVVLDFVGILALVLVGYYVVWATLHLAVVIVGAIQFRRLASRSTALSDGPALTVAVAAYDERPTVVSSIESLLSSSYPLSVVLIDDGSTDGTFEAVEAAFDLGPATVEADLPTDCETYAARDRPLTVLRQPNSGKATALNRALALTETPLFGVVDADTVVETETIGRLVAAFESPEVVAAGGSFRVTETPAAHDAAVGRSLARSWIERFQALDHLRVFVLRQLGRSASGTMFTIFGATSMFRTALLRDVGGFSDVETEDFEVAVALRRHCLETGRRCRFAHVPHAVAWTTVPADLAGLTRQRQRWVTGIVETVSRHRRVVGRPSYGRFGAIALPYALFGELLWLLVESIGYFLVPVAWALGVVSTPVLGAFLVATLVLGPLASVVAILATYCQTEGYDRRDRRSLLATAVLERLLYRPTQAFLGTYSVTDYFR